MSGINFQGETEQSLVEALKQGRQEVLGLLYDAYAPVMMGVILRIVPDREVAEEVLQETFLAIWSRIGIYDSSKKRFLIWGLAIARGIALEALKSGKYKPARQEEDMSDAACAEDVKNKLLQAGQLENEPLCNLEPKEKAILELIYLKGRNCAEAAAELGLSEESLKLTLKKAFIHLKAEKSA